MWASNWAHTIVIPIFEESAIKQEEIKDGSSRKVKFLQIYSNQLVT